MASYEKRGRTVRAIVRVAGGGKRTATFDTMAQAKAWARDLERKKAAGSLGSADGITVGDMLECYLDDVAAKTDSAKWNTVRIHTFLRDPLAQRALANVITHDIDQWISRRLITPSARTGAPLLPATVNRELNLLSAAFTYAIKTRRWIQENPCHGANRPPEGKARDRRLLTPDEIRALCVATGYAPDIPLKTIGARSSHVQAHRTVPLTGRAVEILDQLLQTMPQGQPYIVGLTDQQRDANWRKYRDMADVQDLHFHDAKHEAATRLCKFLDVIALSHAIGTKNLRLLRDTYYNNDAAHAATLLPERLAVHA